MAGVYVDGWYDDVVDGVYDECDELDEVDG